MIAAAIKKAALALLAPIIVLGLAEGGLRLAGYGHPTRFLVPARHAGQAVWHDNQFFGYRFFAPSLARAPAAIALPAARATNTCRVAILGESAALGDPMPEFGLARLLASRLAREYPGVRFEVANAAMTAIDSHVVAEIARDLAVWRPDVVVVYMGNNEVVGPFGPAAMRGTPAGFLGSRARVMLSRLRLTQLLRHIAARILPDPQGDAAWTGMSLFQETLLPRRAPELRAVYAGFERNLQRIIHEARNCGAQVVLCTVAVNLHDSPPFASVPRADLAPESRAAWLHAYEEGARRQAAGDLRGALAALEEAARLDPEFAEVTFRRAQCLAALGSAADAERLFRDARDQDALRFRADSRINAILRAQAGHPGVELVDAETQLAAGSPGALNDRACFLDHVHLTFSGTAWLADLVAPAVARLAGLGAPAPAPRDDPLPVLFAPAIQADILDTMLRRRQTAPFTWQMDNDEQCSRLAREMERLQTEVTPAAMNQLQAQYEAAIIRHPDDACYPLVWGQVLLNHGQYAAALHYLGRARGLWPHRHDVAGSMLPALGALGREAEGVALVNKLPADSGFYPVQMLLESAAVLARDGQPAAAMAYTEAALRRAPGSVVAALAMAQRCAEQPQGMAEAEQRLRAVLALHPRSLPAAAELAALLIVTGRGAEAVDWLQAWRRADPGNRALQLQLAKALLLAGHPAAARRELEDLAAAMPANREIREYLMAAKSGSAPSPDAR